MQPANELDALDGVGTPGALVKLVPDPLGLAALRHPVLLETRALFDERRHDRHDPRSHRVRNDVPTQHQLDDPKQVVQDTPHCRSASCQRVSQAAVATDSHDDPPASAARSRSGWRRARVPAEQP